jgi:hypothetical protein
VKEMRLAGIDSIEAANHFWRRASFPSGSSVLRWQHEIHGMSIGDWGANSTWKKS